MANPTVYFGLKPVKHLFGGQVRSNPYDILNNAGTGYGTNIFSGDPVTLAADGTLNLCPVNTALIGVFAGCSFTDSNNNLIPFQPYWPASQLVKVGSRIIAYVWDDPNIEFLIRVGSTDAFALTNVGNNADHHAQTANATAAAMIAAGGQSTTSLNINGIDNSTAQWRILGLHETPDNAYGANALVRVKANEHMFLSTSGI